MASSPAANVSMFIWSLPIVVQFFVSRSAASTAHDVIGGTCFGSVWIMSYRLHSQFDVISFSFWSCISMPWFSRIVLNLSWPSFCVVRTFVRLIDTHMVDGLHPWHKAIIYNRAAYLTCNSPSSVADVDQTYNAWCYYAHTSCFIKHRFIKTLIN